MMMGPGEKLIVGPASWSWGGSWALFQHTGSVPNANWAGFIPLPALGANVVESLREYNGKLYLGCNGAVYVYTPATGWQVSLSAPGKIFYCLYIYGNKLYAGGSTSVEYFFEPSGINGSIYILNGSNWVDGNPATPAVIDPVFTASNPVSIWVPWSGTSTKEPIWNIAGYQGKLYAAACNLYVSNDGGQTWSLTPARTGPATSIYLMNVFVYNNVLYGVSYWLYQAWGNTRYSAGSLYSYNPTTDRWTVVPGAPWWIRSMCEYNGSLYVGTQRTASSSWLNAGNGGLVYRMGAKSHFDDISISPQEVVFDSSTIVNGVNNVYRYQTCKSSSEDEVNRFKSYRLRYETGTRKLYREKSANGGATWQAEGLNGDGVICENVKKLRIFNRGQESFDIELELEKTVQEGKVKSYKLRTTITPNIS